jgi:hypothetical protein
MSYSLGDRVCISGYVVTNNKPISSGFGDDFRTEYFSGNDGCGTVVRINTSDSVSVKLDSGRYAPEVPVSNIVSKSGYSGFTFMSSPTSSCAFKVMDYVVVSGTIITKTHPFASTYSMQYIAHATGTIIRVNNDNTFLIKLSEDLYGIDVPCHMIANSLTSGIIAVQQDVLPKFLPIVNSKSDLKGYYPVLNKDPIFQAEVIRYFRNKIVDNWIYEKLKPLAEYFVVDGNSGKARWRNKNEEKDENTITAIAKKAEFIKDYVLTKKMIRKILENFIVENDISWYDLKKLQKELEINFLIGLDKKFKKRGDL